MKKFLFLTSITMIMVGCALIGSKTSYQTISATETAVLAANSAYLDAVVTGTAKTNGVPTVEKAFNELQIALHAAAAVASGGSGAAVPPSLLSQASAFTNTINLNK